MRNFEWSELTPREHLGVFFGLTPSRLTISIFDSSRRTAAATALSADGAPEFVVVTALPGSGSILARATTDHKTTLSSLREDATSVILISVIAFAGSRSTDTRATQSAVIDRDDLGQAPSASRPNTAQAARTRCQSG
jgi:hypothetical protein